MQLRILLQESINFTNSCNMIVKISPYRTPFRTMSYAKIDHIIDMGIQNNKNTVGGKQLYNMRKQHHFPLNPVECWKNAVWKQVNNFSEFIYSIKYNTVIIYIPIINLKKVFTLFPIEPYPCCTLGLIG